MKIFVRSRKDLKALEKITSKIYKDVEIYTLGGARREELNEKIKELKEEVKDYTIVLLGKEDRKYVEVEENPIFKIHFVPKKKVRNVKLNLLFKEIEKAKFRFILDVYFEENYYKLGRRSNFILDYPLGSDIYMLIFNEYFDFLSKKINTKKYPLVLHQKDKEILYSGDKVIARIERSLDRFEIHETGLEPVEVSFEKTVKKNIDYINKKIKVFEEKVKEKAKNFDNIVVPWSGGKDSTTILILLKKYVKIDFIPIFVDTGLEFNETLEYLDVISEKLNIDYEVANAGIDKEYKEKGYEFLLKRECTKLKVKALYEYIRKNFDNILIINGDRISESEARSLRSEFRFDEFYILSPIKYWSFLDEQILFHLNKIPWNPLYEKGFYRIGCNVCPFLDYFERSLTLNP